MDGLLLAGANMSIILVLGAGAKGVPDTGKFSMGGVDMAIKGGSGLDSLVTVWDSISRGDSVSNGSSRDVVKSEELGCS